MKAHSKDGSKVYSDEAGAYKGLPNHEAVKHSVGEFVNGMAHTNGIESFWAMLKRGYHGVYHRLSPKHLQRYVNEFAGRHNIRNLDTLDQMTEVVCALVGKRLMYRDLTAPAEHWAVVVFGVLPVDVGTDVAEFVEVGEIGQGRASREHESPCRSTGLGKRASPKTCVSRERYLVWPETVKTRVRGRTTSTGHRPVVSCAARFSLSPRGRSLVAPMV